MHLLAFVTSLASAYTLHTTDDGGVVRWPVFPVAYTVDTAGTDGIDDPEGLVRGAFDAWDGTSDTDVAFDADPDAENVVWFSEDWPFDEDLLAITTAQSNAQGELVAFDIRVNGTQRWSTDGAPDTYDLQAAIAHEVGHALGLEHSEFEDATMFATIGHGDLSPREIADDDRAALEFLYVPEDAPPPSSPADVTLLPSCSTTGGSAGFGWVVLLALVGIRRRA